MKSNDADTAIWFSRHAPTPEQLAEIEQLGFTLAEIESGRALGAVDIREEHDIHRVVDGLCDLCEANGASAVFGVFPTPILHRSAMNYTAAVGRGDFYPDTITLFGSWNVSRSTEGGKPSFVHKEWMNVGILLTWRTPTCL